MLLMFAGYDVAMADNGISAVSELNRHVPDLIVTDLNMPLMSGTELISYVRSVYPKISIVAMSGDYQADAISASRVADRFYPKGQHPQNLLAAIASLIATHPGRESAGENCTRPALEPLEMRRTQCSEPS
jgi:CheY-like chemotaxis protein